MATTPTTPKTQDSFWRPIAFGLVLAVSLALVVAGFLAYVYWEKINDWFSGTETILPEEWVWRRTGLTGPALFIPVLLALFGAVLILGLRHKDELNSLARRLPSALRWLLLSLVFGAVLLLGLYQLLAWTEVISFPPIPLPPAITLAVLSVALLLMLGGMVLFVFLHGHTHEALLALVLSLGLAGAAVLAGVSVFTDLYSSALEKRYAWLTVLIPIDVIALVYVTAMYFADMRTVHSLWAFFLAFLRLGVYFLLSICFALPIYREITTTVTESKVLVLFDVSGSMDAVDGGSTEGGITRREKIIRFLTEPYEQGSANKTFLQHLTGMTAVSCYRFGTVADEDAIVFDARTKKAWTAEDWGRWFRPDEISREEIVKNMPDSITDPAKKADFVQRKMALYAQLREGTDVGGSVLQILKREGNSHIQAVIVFSDGNSNRGDEAAIREVLELAGNAERPIHVITVGVGDYKQPVRIRINPLMAPEAVRADESTFEVRVQVYGDGLLNENFDVTLEARRVKDSTGSEVKKPQVYTVRKEKGKFGTKIEGAYPYDEIVFKVNLQELTKINAAKDTQGLLQGQWEFVAKVPRHPREAVDKDKPLHVSPPRYVMVNDSTLKVLLFAGGPSRDYEFVRRLLVSEADAKRAQLSIYLQTAKGLDDVQQDVESKYLLDSFPTKLERPKEVKAKEGSKDAKKEAAKERDPLNLKSYDVIIAFDPDWTELTKTQKYLLQEWVEGEHGGGFIFVAGPLNTPKLVPPVSAEKLQNWDLKPIYSLLPVVLDRLPGSIRPEALQDMEIPHKLQFEDFAKRHDFLKIDDEKAGPFGGWDEFFGKYVTESYPGEVIKAHPEHGFHGLHNYVTVVKEKDGAEVLARMIDTRGPKSEGGKMQPFFVSQQIKKGKSFYIASGDMHQLQSYNKEYFQRFWVKLARYVSSGSGGKSFGHFSMAGEYVRGLIPIEAEVRDKDGFFLKPQTPPLVTIRRLDTQGSKNEKLPSVLLEPKKKQQAEASVKTPSFWPGVFTGKVQLDKEGLYEARIDIAGSEESITQSFEVKAPNVEMQDLRTNFPKLFSLATEATAKVLARLDKETRHRLEQGVERPPGAAAKETSSAAGAKLFFRLATAPSVSQCLIAVPADTVTTAGPLVAANDWWSSAPKVYEQKSWLPDLWWLVVSMFVLPALAALIVIVLMLVSGRWIAALVLAAALIAIELGLYWVLEFTVPDSLFQPSAFGVLLVVPLLISLAAAGILMIAERFVWSMVVLAGLLVYLGILLLVNQIAAPEWWPMQVDFPPMLLLLALLLSTEWFTRKMLRLA